MEGLCLPCPKCGWLNPLINCSGYVEGAINYNVRCTHCGWHGTIKLKATITQTGSTEVDE